MRSKMFWAALALVAVLGITTAASATTRGWVTGKQIAPHSINSKHLVNHTIQAHDISNKAIASFSVKHAKTADTATEATYSSEADQADSATNAQSATNATTAEAATGLPGPLASGQTERGAFGVAGHKDTAIDFVSETAISFAIPLATTPTFQFVTGGPTTQCPGSATDPQATAGYLCLYAHVLTGATGMSTSVEGRFGYSIFPSGVAADSNYEVDGTWAVTAP